MIYNFRMQLPSIYNPANGESEVKLIKEEILDKAGAELAKQIMRRLDPTVNIWHEREYVISEVQFDTHSLDYAPSKERKGQWIYDEKNLRCVCSECSHYTDMIVFDYSVFKDHSKEQKYCFNCGAKMDGERRTE